MKTLIKTIAAASLGLWLLGCEEKAPPPPPPAPAPAPVAKAPPPPPAPEIPPELKAAAEKDITQENAEQVAADLEKELAAEAD